MSEVCIVWERAHHQSFTRGAQADPLALDTGIIRCHGA